MNRTDINEIETKKATEKINETKRWFFEKINKMINLQKVYQGKKKKAHQEEKAGRQHKSVKLEIGQEKLQITLQKQKGL